MSRLLALVALLGACSDREAPAAGSGSAPRVNAPPPPPVPAGDRVGTTGPSLAVIDAPPPPADARAIAPFSDERRDDAWAKATEASLRASLGGLDGAASVGVECRSSQCRVTLRAEPGRATAAAGELESALRGQATAIVFADTGAKPDEVVVYVQLPR